MMINRPRGISLNKNALNIQSTPSPPKLKTHFIQEQQPLKENGPLITKPGPKQEQENSMISRIPKLKLKAPSERLEPVRESLKTISDESEEEIEDIDKSPSRDAIFLVCDVAKDIYEYMYLLEREQSVEQDYLKEQKILTPKVRQRLVNWCIETHSQLKLLPETLYMTIAVIDRYFAQVTVKQQSQVQLVALGAILIASKYEEIYPPDVADLIYLTQNSYTRREIMRVEIEMLEQLNFNLGKPIPLAFLRRFSRAAHCDVKVHSIAKYLMELSLAEYECCHWHPSLLAAASLYTAIHLVDIDASSSAFTLFSGLARRNAQSPVIKNRWNRSLVHYTNYSKHQLQEPAATLCKLLKRVQQNPQFYYCVKKNANNLSKWQELKSFNVARFEDFLTPKEPTPS